MPHCIPLSTCSSEQSPPASISPSPTTPLPSHSAPSSWRPSYAAIDGEQLVGLLVHAVDDYRGAHAAFTFLAGVISPPTAVKASFPYFSNTLDLSCEHRVSPPTISTCSNKTPEAQALRAPWLADPTRTRHPPSQQHHTRALRLGDMAAAVPRATSTRRHPPHLRK